MTSIPETDRDRIFGDRLADHKGTLLKVVCAHASGPADRQDLFQEVALQVWRSVDAYRGDSSVPTWIYRIALNAAISWTRRQDRHQQAVPVAHRNRAGAQPAFG